MKKLVISLLAFTLILNLNAQVAPALKADEYTLSNGFTVFLNPDHTQPNMMGSVVIRGGSKRDPENATGIAHYFEHIMFKGTQHFGTVDYNSEKVYLDSIEVAYDELAVASSEEQKSQIQLKINRLNIEAAKYAIPNEFDKMMVQMGGTAINAYTNMECIVYHNQFPPNQIEKWLKVYYDRFTNPVFRLFQSELETVYEEKNMSMDSPFERMIETYQKSFYKQHPYGQHTVLGSIEHLKTPSLSKMKAFYETYYVANNMALILTGDFDPEEVKPLLEETFGQLRTGEIPPMKKYEESQFNGREFISKRMTPIKVGIMGYRTVKMGDPDELILEVANNILSNGSSGLLDQLRLDNKLMMAMMQNNNQVDMGGTMVIFVPKVVGQSLNNAEKLVDEQIEKLKSGNFDDDLFESTKLNLLKSFNEKLENMRWRSYFITDAFLIGQKWDDYLKYPELLSKITKEDVIKVANKYYGKNKLVVYSKMGFPKKNKLDKPPYKPVIPENSEKQSEFAKQINQIEVKDAPPQFIDLGKDVQLTELMDKVHLYTTENPINDIFSLRLNFGTGTYYNKKLAATLALIEYMGTKEHDAKAYKNEMHKLGAEYYGNANKSNFTISLSGLEQNLVPTLKLFNELLTEAVCTDDDIKKIAQDEKLNERMEQKDPSSIGTALYNYARYGDKSENINKLNAKEIKGLSPNEYLAIFKDALKYEVDIQYCGKLSTNEIKQALLNNLSLEQDRISTLETQNIEISKATENTIYFVDESKAIQSQVYFIINGNEIVNENRANADAFNKYFGGNMNSIVFQEIREFRSLAYSAWARFRMPMINGNNGYLMGKVSTQADKTNESIDVFLDLLTNMPYKTERLETVKSGLIQNINSSRPSFRYTGNNVAYWHKQGYDNDPRKEKMEKYENLSFDDISSFYESQIKGKNYTITVVGDKKRINMEELAKHGKIIELSKKDIFN